MDTSTERAVLHVDIDAFFAAIEQLRDPRLRDRPVIVGAGVIASCSYEARRFGLHAGMTLSEARRLCPKAVILEGHAQVYRSFAESIFERCREISPSVETFLDEAYCDLSGTTASRRPLEAVRRTQESYPRGHRPHCHLWAGTQSLLAKLIGKTSKPDGLQRPPASQADGFLRDRPMSSSRASGGSRRPCAP
jgi:DNA polymerase-4